MCKLHTPEKDRPLSHRETMLIASLWKHDKHFEGHESNGPTCDFFTSFNSSRTYHWAAEHKGHLNACSPETHLGLSGEGLGLRGGGVRGTAGFGAMLAAGRRPWTICFCTNETQPGHWCMGSPDSRHHPSLGPRGDTCTGHPRIEPHQEPTWPWRHAHPENTTAAAHCGGSLVFPPQRGLPDNPSQSPSRTLLVSQHDPRLLQSLTCCPSQNGSFLRAGNLLVFINPGTQVLPSLLNIW